MKNFILRLLAVIYCVWTMAAYAEITLEPPPGVSMNLDSDEFHQFMAARNDLLAQFGATQNEIDSQAQNCHDVAEDSPKVSECMTQAQEVRAAVRNYRAALAQFKARLGASEFSQQLKSKLDNELPPPATHHLRPITIEYHGDFHVVMADGRKLAGKEATHLTEDDEASLVTGSNAGAVLKLSDNTQITLGSNTQLKTNVPDPNPGADKSPMLKLVKGTLHWFHQTKQELGEPFMVEHHRVDFVAVVVAERGTKFDCAVLPDGSGYIKLYSGAVDLTPRNGGKVVKLHPGQMVTIRGGEISSPVPMR